MDVGAVNPWKIVLKATYQNKTIRLVLADVALSADPLIAPENMIKHMTLDIFVQCFKEALMIVNVQVELLCRHPKDAQPTKILKNRQLRGAIEIYILIPNDSSGGENLWISNNH